jgi:hypothetical protein
MLFAALICSKVLKMCFWVQTRQAAGFGPSPSRRQFLMNQSICAKLETPDNILNDDESERLILEHLAQVKVIAKRIYNRIPPGVELSDLVSAGVLG